MAYIYTRIFARATRALDPLLRQHPGHLRVANSIGRLERSLKRPNFVRITQNSGQCSESRWKLRNKSKGVVAFPCSKSKKNLQKRPKIAQNSRRSYPQQ